MQPSSISPREAIPALPEPRAGGSRHEHLTVDDTSDLRLGVRSGGHRHHDRHAAIGRHLVPRPAGERVLHHLDALNNAFEQGVRPRICWCQVTLKKRSEKRGSDELWPDEEPSCRNLTIFVIEYTIER